MMEEARVNLLRPLVWTTFQDGCSKASEMYGVALRTPPDGSSKKSWISHCNAKAAVHFQAEL
jgi:hypothetical protein